MCENAVNERNYIMKILVINAGSSSIKFQVIEMPEGKMLSKGMCDSIGVTDKDGNLTSSFKIESIGKEKFKQPMPMSNHTEAMSIVIKYLTDEQYGVIADMSEIGAVGHRVLHGGEKFSGSVIVTEQVKDAIRECFVFGPLHNPANLNGIEVCEELFKGIPQVAVFDTGFHQTMPDYAYMYALPYEYYENYGVRRYGFHGTSHRYVTLRAAAMLGKKPEEVNIVTCHLGNGSSISAVKGGKCFDTTMGLTPLEGILMGTRCGSIDPAIIPFIMEKTGMNAKEIDTMMNKKSGILGITGGVTSDNREIEDGAKAGNKRYQLVESMLCHQLTKYIGGFAAAMGGADAIVFCGGIGENNPQYRTRVAEKLGFLGVAIDEEINAKAKRTDDEYDISTPDAKVRMLVIPTNEEFMIAKDTFELAGK